MIYDEFSPSRTRRTLTAGGRTLRALGLDDLDGLVPEVANSPLAEARGEPARENHRLHQPKT